MISASVPEMANARMTKELGTPILPMGCYFPPVSHADWNIRRISAYKASIRGLLVDANAAGIGQVELATANHPLTSHSFRLGFCLAHG